MLVGLAYVEWAAAKVLLQRHKNVPGQNRGFAGIFLNCFMFLTSRGGVSGLLGVQ
jgi:hypothetical protein